MTSALLTLLLAAPPGAAAPGVEGHDALLEAFWSAMDPAASVSPAARQARDRELQDRGFHCATELLLQIEAHRDDFSPQQLADIDAVLLTPVQTGASVPPPAAPATSPCFEFGLGNSLYGEHFVIEYEDGVSEDKAQDFLDELEFSWEKLFDELGWRNPNGHAQYLVVAGIQNNGGAGAYTYYAECAAAPGGWMPYMVAGENSFGSSAGTFAKTMPGHELNHASQFGYGFTTEFWWYEATATWVEEYIHPTYNDWSGFTQYFSYYPYIGLNASQGSSNDSALFGHTYAMAVWGFYLDEYVGGHDLVMGTWETARGSGADYYEYWMPDTIEDQGEDFDALWTEFMAVTTVMAFEEERYFVDPQEAVDEVDELPASGDAASRTAPQSLGLNYVIFDEDLGGSGDALELSFDGEDGPEWYAVLVRADIEESEIDEIVVIELDEDGDGTASIDMSSGTNIILVVSPKDEDAKGYDYNWDRADDFDFDWDAALTEAGGEGGGEGGGGTGEPTLVDDDDDGGCSGCSPAGVAPVAALWMAGLVGLGLRRREV